MRKDEIREIVKETVNELRRSGLLKLEEGYDKIVTELQHYYDSGEQNVKMKSILDDIDNDKYFIIIPLYFKEHCTISDIAEQLNVDNSTVTRNKRRLCLHIYSQYV